MTAEPTNVVILQVGAIPVFADVDVNSGNLDPKDIERKITEKTKAIVVVHYAGIPVRLAEIAEIAKKHHIPLIEDCAHALGARYANRSIGCIGDFAIFSMQAIKHMTTVDGGILTFKDETLLRSAKKFRWFGLEKGIPRTEVDINSVGYKYNMHNVAATIGLAQLDVIDGLISRHISNGRYFDEHISKIPGLSVPFFDEVASPSYWLYTIFSDDSSNIEKLLSNIGVAANKLHRPNHYHSIFKPFAGVLPELEKYYQNMIHIPCGWWVSDEDRDRIVKCIAKRLGMMNLPLFGGVNSAEMERVVVDVLRSGKIASGEYVTKFEAGLGELLGKKNVVTTVDMTSAMHLALYIAWGGC